MCGSTQVSRAFICKIRTKRPAGEIFSPTRELLWILPLCGNSECYFYLCTFRRLLWSTFSCKGWIQLMGITESWRSNFLAFEFRKWKTYRLFKERVTRQACNPIRNKEEGVFCTDYFPAWKDKNLRMGRSGWYFSEDERIERTHGRWGRDWPLSSHHPWALSFQVIVSAWQVAPTAFGLAGLAT